MSALPPTACPAWRKLAARAAAKRPAIAGLFAKNPRRAAQCAAQAPGVRLDYSRQRVDRKTLELLCRFARERGLEERAAPPYAALRAGDGAPGEVRVSLQRISNLARQIREEKKFRRIVNLGIGGSDLGPRLLADALGDGTLEARFVANADPLELERALRGADPATTLFVIASRTFTTPETLANAERARRWGGKAFFAATSNVAAARAFGAGEILPLPDWVVGRFSVWSAAAFAGVCSIGIGAFEQFLAGARDMDAHFAETPLERNLPALLALLGAWNVNFLDCRAHAVLPYAHALRLLPAYLQQLEMESNGKRVDLQGRPVGYATAPVVFGAEGTPSQHSFHQLLHQGTQVVPVDFVVAGNDAFLESNARAQADALAWGTQEPGLPSNRRHPGNRPSNTIQLETPDARNLGRLLALYEHKVYVQGLLWNINSFDQWGAELGKRLARDILSKRT